MAVCRLIQEEEITDRKLRHKESSFYQIEQGIYQGHRLTYVFLNPGHNLEKVNSLCQLNHPYLVPMVGFVPKKWDQSEHDLVLDYFNWGLFDILDRDVEEQKKGNLVLTDASRVNICQQILSAFTYLDSQDIACLITRYTVVLDYASDLQLFTARVLYVDELSVAADVFRRGFATTFPQGNVRFNAFFQSGGNTSQSNVFGIASLIYLILNKSDYKSIINAPTREYPPNWPSKLKATLRSINETFPFDKRPKLAELSEVIRELVERVNETGAIDMNF